MKYCIIMLLLFLTSSTLTENNHNVCITIRDVNGVRLHGIGVKIYEAGKGWHGGSTNNRGDVYFTVTPVNHCDVFVQNPTHFLNPKPVTSFIVGSNTELFYLTIDLPGKWPGQR